MQSQALVMKHDFRKNLYTKPVLGYFLKLIASLLRLPTRLAQIHERLDRLENQSGSMDHKLNLVDSELQNSKLNLTILNRDVLEKHGTLWQELSVLRELNHNVMVSNEVFRDQARETLTRSMELANSVKRQTQPHKNIDSPLACNEVPQVLSAAFYAAFERHFRRENEQIYQHFDNYKSFLEQIPSNISALRALDLGCGRGEWLKTLQNWGVQAVGVDSNDSTNASALEQNLSIVEDDGLSFLRKQHNNSFKLISGFHIVEHLESVYLVDLIHECYRTLAPGGLLILETPNPENVLVGSCNFYIDLTHKHPIPPPTLGFIIEYCGFQQIDCLRFNPVMAPYEGGDPHLQQLSRLLTSGQDYAIIAKKPISD